MMTRGRNIVKGIHIFKKSECIVKNVFIALTKIIRRFHLTTTLFI